LSSFGFADFEDPVLSPTDFIAAASITDLNALSKSNPRISAEAILIATVITLPNFLVMMKNAKSLFVLPFDLKYR
jgi:hypothetical protein